MPRDITEFRGQNRFLSNFWPCHIGYEGGTYSSVEHAYQAAKTTDLVLRRPFQDERMSAGQAKRLGKALLMRDDWDDVKVGIMRALLIRKFANPHLRRQLTDTAPAKLVEGNHWGDTFWGVCCGTGRNQLGKLLMEIRDAQGRQD